jgi:hypothetical protein
MVETVMVEEAVMVEENVMVEEAITEKNLQEGVVIVDFL